MTAAAPNTDELLARTAQGDSQAREQLLARHRARLRKMVAYHLDRRLHARVDASDVVQEVLVEASRRLGQYLQQRPLPFYPWLRQLAEKHLIDLRRRHVGAQKRSIDREEPDVLHLPDESAAELAARLVTSATSPSQRLLREEARQRVQAALAQLAASDRRVLQLRHLEQLSVAETAAVLGISEGAVKTRNVRALQRLRALLDEMGGSAP
jgi:RNA polymerase sigma-70 factor (ECF subfamily)